MIKLLLLVFMIFFHLLDDYALQGILAQMKQRDWWEKNVPRGSYPLCKYDYIVALIEHAFSWTVMVHIPAWIFSYIYGAKQRPATLVLAFLLCWGVHAIVDHAKANWHVINLIMDQSIHLWQVIIIWLLYI